MTGIHIYKMKLGVSMLHKNLYKSLGLRNSGVVNRLTEVGIEIEYEGNNFPRRIGNTWTTTRDGSLNVGEGIEYVSKPLKRDEVAPALYSLRRSFKSYSTQVTPTVRAGTHVHVSVQDLREYQLFNYIVAYGILDNAITEQYCGPTRAGNLFALRFSEAEYSMFMLEMVARDIKKRSVLLKSSEIRYSSMNLNSIFKYGTVEFRSMRSSDMPADIKTFVDIVLSIKDFSKRFDNPTNMYKYIKKDTARFVKEALGKRLKVFDQDKLLQSVDEGIRTFNHLVHIGEWNK
jgi:hypothetical protein